MSKKTFTTAVLFLSMNAAFAAGFEPWSGRGHDTPDSTAGTMSTESFYRHGKSNIPDTVDQRQPELVLVPWYFQGQGV